LVKAAPYPGTSDFESNLTQNELSRFAMFSDTVTGISIKPVIFEGMEANLEVQSEDRTKYLEEQIQSLQKENSALKSKSKVSPAFYD
jgi:hypothetical protein